MNRKQDKRNLNTKIELSNAFKELSKKKQMNKISVNDLIQYCGLNRNTFYYHFEDIYDLINWIFDKEVKTIIENFDRTNYENFLNRVMYYIEENKHILNSAYNSFGREQLKKILQPYFYIALNKIIDNHIEKENLTIDDNFKNFLIDFYSGGAGELIVSYCKGEQHIDRKILLKYLFSIIDSMPIEVKMKLNFKNKDRKNQNN